LNFKVFLDSYAASYNWAAIVFPMSDFELAIAFKELAEPYLTDQVVLLGCEVRCIDNLLMLKIVEAAKAKGIDIKSIQLKYAGCDILMG